MEKGLKKVIKNQKGAGVVEVILVLLVLVGLVLIFKSQIVGIANGIFLDITKQVNSL
ncbi:Flp1 family type IVb pilin [Parasporobacterium paucivorans]|uniref:Putative Flagellin, Flp1-like, domain n=1 Tax=Parasporobacterium paucivorans DSM 15970 TaxID=1122934 RepID=A0A1M6JAL8_9FIRM|nr:Flp1 family type IVb pilin [Parasporobacterium paucivorans]SHJ43703.1 Putative Flagellin, Flp1-like, domain [Parasporobacterium paucivorans DSM 15970]